MKPTQVRGCHLLGRIASVTAAGLGCGSGGCCPFSYVTSATRIPHAWHEALPTPVIGGKMLEWCRQVGKEHMGGASRGAEGAGGDASQ